MCRKDWPRPESDRLLVRSCVPRQVRVGACPIASKLLVINVVGLTPRLLGDRTPRLRALASSGFQANLDGVFPAVTCSAQASMLTGKLPTEHGIVGNGWYF